MVEKNLQKECIDFARSLNLFIYSINPPSFKRMTYGTMKQMPDCHIVDFNAYFEFKDEAYWKAHKDRQEKQDKIRNELIKHNAMCYKIKTLNEFKEILQILIN